MIYIYKNKIRKGDIEQRSIKYLSGIILSAILVILTTNYALSREITFQFEPPSTNILGYKIYYKTGTNSEPPYNGVGINEGDSPIVIGKVTTYTLTGLSQDLTYHFVMTSYDKVDESGYSSSYTVTPDGASVQAPQMFRLIVEP